MKGCVVRHVLLYYLWKKGLRVSGHGLAMDPGGKGGREVPLKRDANHSLEKKARISREKNVNRLRKRGMFLYLHICLISNNLQDVLFPCPVSGPLPPFPRAGICKK